MTPVTFRLRPRGSREYDGGLAGDVGCPFPTHKFLYSPIPKPGTSDTLVPVLFGTPPGTGRWGPFYSRHYLDVSVGAYQWRSDFMHQITLLLQTVNGQDSDPRFLRTLSRGGVDLSLHDCRLCGQ